ncbi:hypothetical protein [Polyangium jinanense]|uniref:DUF2065 domain-containing protein n=1 Tax=Polyangium jinanense TaxID=2829994 RepID=A0A9X3XHH5_9BACT|nr:hypothetical protein [Polyangium jinanense]MDC3961720.1 hypothetical protein [Polyangium jinanense]MDC3988226.1 hypothetical protein [Polyangium jinanense]
MDSSIYIARLIGPLLLMSGASALFGGKSYRAMVKEFLGSRALIYLSGFMTLLIGLGIVNAWRSGWPIGLTIIGWLFVIGGALRMLFPERLVQVGTAMLDKRPGLLTGAGIVLLLLGLGLSYAGYVP